MDARVVRAAAIAAIVLSTCMGASYRTQNFIVSAQTPQLAQEVCEGAENFRRDLAKDWLGEELPNWQQPCPIVVQAAPNLGAGGATSFVFNGGQPHDFRMNIQGSRERILDSVLPHEVLHTVFATHYGRPLPRWADEGACTTVEHESERGKQHRMLYEFLTTNRGIAFHQMFAMKEYPRDILPLYAQGYSLARFFIEQGGKRKYVAYVGEGMDTNNWTTTTQKYYGHKSLGDLQTSWLGWVRQGSPELPLAAREPARAPAAAVNPVSLAAHNAPPANDLSRYAAPKGAVNTSLPPTHAGVASLAMALTRAEPPKSNYTAAAATTEGYAPAPRNDGLVNVAPGAPPPNSPGSWYVRGAAPAVATTSPPVSSPGIPWQQPGNRPGAPLVPPQDLPPVDQTMSRPPAPEQPRQIILEWSKLPGGQQR